MNRQEKPMEYPAEIRVAVKQRHIDKAIPTSSVQ